MEATKRVPFSATTGNFHPKQANMRDGDWREHSFGSYMGQKEAKQEVNT